MADPLQNWKSLSIRIEGFIRAFKIWSQMHSALASAEQSRQMLKWAKAIAIDLNNFKSDFENSLQINSIECINNERMRMIANDSHTGYQPGQVQSFVSEMALIFSEIENELNYSLRDSDIKLKIITERALLHLQWLIFSNAEIGAQWKHAYASGETACEKLGACHLISHGIYAFKARARAITDLIVGEPVKSEDASASEGLVLTEWKLVKKTSELSQVISAARHQSDEYADGLLGNTHLRTIRYIIFVTDKKIAAPEDVHMNGYIYRHKNIAVDPETPHEVGKKFAKAKV